MKSLRKMIQKWHFGKLIFLRNFLFLSLLLIIFSCGSEERKEPYSSEESTKEEQTTASFENFEEEIVVEHPAPGEMISSPLKIKGKARGSWFFEATAPVELVSVKGEAIAQGYLTARGDWMTEDFVPFEAVIKFPKPKTAAGFLVLKNANPSGLPEQEKTIRIPVYFAD